MIRVSVVTPAYNSAATIARCVSSIKAQTYHNIEHIVIDGGSTDGTVELLHELGVRCVSEPDAGIYHAMNKGVRMASGEIIHILNSDDWYSDNDVVSTMVALMQSQQLDVAHAYVSQVDASGVAIWRIGGDVMLSQLYQKMKVAHPSCFVRSSVYDRYGDFSSGFRIAADYDFVLRIWANVKVGFLPKCIVKMQIDGVSNGSPVSSYKESMAVAMVHGKAIFPALFTFILECFKHYIVLFVRLLGWCNRGI